MTSSEVIEPATRFEEFTRRRWAATASGSVGRRPIGPVPADELAEVYLPLAEWVADRISAGDGRPPFLVSITGSVAVGKSASALVLQSLLEARTGTTVALIPTDSFLYPNAVLEDRGLLARKGFPETFDREAMAETLVALGRGQAEVAIPIYSHQAYDILAGQHHRVRRPTVVILDGIYPLVPGHRPGGRAASPGCDLSIYVDAAEEDIAAWFTARLVRLVDEAPAGTDGLFGRLAALTPSELDEVAAATWTGVNLANLRQHILPTRAWADLILWKGADHRVQRVLVRREP
jgi:type I pantothenate kinase